MFEELDKYENSGKFIFKQGNKLKEVSAGVPNLPGVYCIYRKRRGSKDLVNIGISGTMLPDGKFNNQLLKERLNNKQDKMPRQKFFEKKMMEEGSDTLIIHWHVTFDEKNQDIPSYVKGLLLQRYFEIYGRLPEWNKRY